MELKNFFGRKGKQGKGPASEVKSLPKSDLAIITKIVSEFKDRNRKQIKEWRDALTAAENPENPRWYLLQDLYDDTIDAHLASVIDTRKMTTTNHRFYVVDKKSGEQLQEQSQFLDKKWFFDFLDYVLDAIFKKYTYLQIMKGIDDPVIVFVPRRNLCPQFHRLYTEILGDKFIDLKSEADVIEISHNSPFGILNDVMPNCIWKKNALQAWAEFGEKFGMPLITATTPNKAEVPRIEAMLKLMGEAAQAVLPVGTTIQVHDMANAGNPDGVYNSQAKFHDDQISKRIVGGTMVSDNGASRAQSEVHERTLDEKLSVADQRFFRFVVNDLLFPILQGLGYPFDNTKMKFQFDETESLNLTEHWKIVNEAMATYEIDEQWVAKTFNFPVTGRKETSVNLPNPVKGAKANFNIATSIRAMAVACGVTLPEYPARKLPVATGLSKSLLDQLTIFDEQLAGFLYNGKISDAERKQMLKGKRIAEELRSGLFEGWGNRRIEVDWNAPDHRSLAMMEMNLFRFSESKGRAEVLLLNRLLIDKEKNQIRTERDFIEAAKKINTSFNQTYLSTEYQFAVATGQNSARYLEFIGEKKYIGHWEYQTIGDTHVRDEHATLDGRIFSFDDVAARSLWPPNGWKCRCEGIQSVGKPGDKLMKGKDALPIAFPTPKQLEMFGINRAETGVVFRENQMYLGTLKGADGKIPEGKNINDYTFKDYGLKNWKDLRDKLPPLKLDNTITPDNVKELFKNNAGEGLMGYEDYLKRKLILKEDVFKAHTSGKYLKTAENRHQLFAYLNDVLNNPDELYSRTYSPTKKEQIRYIKLYNDEIIVIDTEITNDGLEIKTWYWIKDAEENVRSGLLMK